MADNSYREELARDPAAWLRRMGSFWRSEMRDIKFLQSYNRGLSFLRQQMDTDFKESVSTLAVDQHVVGHREHWVKFTALESDIERAPWLFGDPGLVFGQPGVVFGGSRLYFRLRLPANVKTAPALGPATDGSPMWTLGVDYRIHSDHIYFTRNPFKQWSNWTNDVFKDGERSDRSLTLFLQEAEMYNGDLNLHWGTVVQSNLNDTETDKQLAMALVDSFTRGLSTSTMECIFALSAGLPVTGWDEETLEALIVDDSHKLAITDKNVYRVPLDAEVPWEVGKIIPPRRSICAAVKIYESARDSIQDLSSISVPYKDGGILIFSNREEIPYMTGSVAAPRVTGTQSSINAFLKSVASFGQPLGDVSNPLRWLIEQTGSYMVIVRLIPDWFIDHIGAGRAVSLVLQTLPSYLRLIVSIERKIKDQYSVTSKDQIVTGMTATGRDRHRVSSTDKVITYHVKD